MNMKILWASAISLGVSVSIGCSDDETPCVGPDCGTPQPCTTATCDDMSADMATDLDASIPDMVQDAEEDFPVSPDMPNDMSQDASPDAMPDAQMDMDPVFPPPAGSTLLSSSVPFVFRDADSLGSGSIAAGTTPDQFVTGESREAVAVHYDGTGVVWASRFGDPSNDQFTAVARRGNEVLLGGVSRGYSVGTSNNNDALLVRVTPAGFGPAFNYGTTGDELLYGLFDGGQVAHWIGVGEAGGGENRDGLVVAFDQSLNVLWATRFETGADDIFFDGAVVGNQIIAVGSTGVRNGARRSLVAAVGNNTVSWAQRGSADDTEALSAIVDGNTVLVAGRVASGANTQPAIMRFGADGAVTGVRFNTPGTATKIALGQRDVVVGYGANRTGMLLSWNGNSAMRLPFESQIMAGFLSNPLFESDGQFRTVFQSRSNTIVDLPFSLTPESSCSSAVEQVSTSSIGAADFAQVTLTPTALAFTGGAIANPRITPITATAQGGVCQP